MNVSHFRAPTPRTCETFIEFGAQCLKPGVPQPAGRGSLKKKGARHSPAKGGGLAGDMSAKFDECFTVSTT